MPTKTIRDNSKNRNNTSHRENDPQTLEEYVNSKVEASLVSKGHVSQEKYQQIEDRGFKMDIWGANMWLATLAAVTCFLLMGAAGSLLPGVFDTIGNDISNLSDDGSIDWWAAGRKYTAMAATGIVSAGAIGYTGYKTYSFVNSEISQCEKAKKRATEKDRLLDPNGQDYQRYVQEYAKSDAKDNNVDRKDLRSVLALDKMITTLTAGLGDAVVTGAGGPAFLYQAGPALPAGADVRDHRGLFKECIHQIRTTFKKGASIEKLETFDQCASSPEVLALLQDMSNGNMSNGSVAGPGFVSRHLSGAGGLRGVVDPAGVAFDVPKEHLLCVRDPMIDGGGAMRVFVRQADPRGGVMYSEIKMGEVTPAGNVNPPVVSAVAMDRAQFDARFQNATHLPFDKVGMEKAFATAVWESGFMDGLSDVQRQCVSTVDSARKTLTDMQNVGGLLSDIQARMKGSLGLDTAEIKEALGKIVKTEQDANNLAAAERVTPVGGVKPPAAQFDNPDAVGPGRKQHKSQGID